MPESEKVDLSDTPISALRDRTRREIALLLNERRVLPTDENIPRDWDGFVHLIKLDNRISRDSKNPTEDALKLWQEQALHNQQRVPSLKDLQGIFCQLDRWDIFYDTEEMLVNDALAYKERLQLRPVTQDSSQPLLHGCLTDQDVERFLAGKELVDYDGFLLYADKDQEFARVIKEKLENDYKLRIVVKDHLISGVGFEVQALTNLITRCAALIVILSPNLFEEPANNYLIGFAAAYSIEQRKSRIIPCSYEHCILPQESIALQYLHCHNYARLTGLKIDFFHKVSQSIRAACQVRGRSLPSIQPSPPTMNQPDIQRCTITEIESEIEVGKPPEVSVSMDTAIVCMSDPTTHFPGNSLENPSEGKWNDHTTSSISNSDSSHELKKNSKSSFLSRKKKWFKEKKWLKKKSAVALAS